MTKHVLKPSDYETQMQSGKIKKPGSEGNCFFQSGKMVAKSGTVSMGGEKNDITNSQEGIDYINNQIDKGYSVRVHVDRTSDGEGDHWVAISSRTINFQTGEVSYGFYDPGASKKSDGINNTFFLMDGVLTGSPTYNKN